VRRVLLVLLVVLGGCTRPAATPPAGPACLDQTGANELPALSLSCLEGGGLVHLGQLKGPMVVNLWASWCEPCARELPALQRLADRNTVTVIGVATDDTRDAAASRAQDLGVRMPMLFDGQGSLRKALGEANLPVTLFVDAMGKVTRYVGPALTDEKLSGLVRERLGVA
jgi:thiol-disulfide isomerase/thioredoxin